MVLPEFDGFSLKTAWHISCPYRDEMRVSFFHSLTFRVLVGPVVLLVLLFGAYSYFTIQSFREEMMRNVVLSASRMSDVIKKSSHYSMLLNRSEDLRHIITTIGTEPGVEGIRIYNKRGEITLSTDKREERTVVDMAAEACYACHDQAKPLGSLPIQNRARIYTGDKGYRILGLINPIRNEPGCSDGGCHAHPEDITVLGVLDVRMSLEQVDAGISQAQSDMVTRSVGMMVLISTLSVLLILHTIVKPVKHLKEGTRQIGEGNLDYTIVVKTRDELGELAHSFNEMTVSLRHEKEENRRWAETLQERIREKTGELRMIHNQILQIEKMASLGKLAATVAHELNNPLEAILTYAKLIARRIKKDESLTERQRRIFEDIDLIVRETERSGNIVKNLLLFSKKQVSEFGLTPIKEIVDKAAQLVQHHFTISNIQLQCDYFDTSAIIMCDENQIQQALIALFVNAVEAMPEGGTIRVETRQDSHGNILINVKDTGIGIATDELPHIFEPFYTTKKNGRGVGLGLSIVYGIIERHGGTVTVTSEPGSGTTFTLRFPPIGKETEHASQARNEV
jgi:two-component system NtrC family sensor kinase